MPVNIRNQFDATEYVKEDNFHSWQLAQDIVENYPLATTVQDDKVYLQNGAVWDEYGEQTLRSEIWHILGNATSQTRVNETVDAVKHLSRTPREDMLGLPPHKVVVENGLVDMLADDPQERLEAESTGAGTFTRVPVEYDPEAAHPEAFQDFLFDVLHADDVSIMWELIGYCLYRGYPFQKAFMFIGEGANGKSTLLNGIRDFLGPDNTSSTELKTLAENRFAAAKLDGKLANIAPDISGKDLEETSTFKALTGGDTLQAEQKYEQPYEFENHATLLFSANQPPRAPDNTHAYERRWLYFDFPNTFDGDNSKPQKEFLDAFEAEHSAILNQAIEGFRRLWERGGFEDTHMMDVQDGVHERVTDPTRVFVQDRMQRQDGATCWINGAFDRYRKWCNDNDHVAQGKRHFKDVVFDEYVPDTGKDPDDGRRTVWFDVSLVGIDADESEESAPAGERPEAGMEEYQEA